MSKKTRIFWIIAILLFASCGTQQYQEIGMGGLGFRISNSQKIELKKPVEDVKTEVLPRGNSNEVVSNIEPIEKPVAQEKRSQKILRKLEKINASLMAKIPEKYRATIDKKLKRKSTIFGYEGENEASTIGFNMMMIGLIVAVGEIGRAHV